MHNVFTKKSAEELQVQLSDGRMMPLEDIVKFYESFLKEVETQDQKVGKWFHIDREIIDKNKDEIWRQCYEEGPRGIALAKCFKAVNKIADEHPEQYPRLIETYIFPYNCDIRTEKEMRDVCEIVGDGMCCEVICYLELQMRICIGEHVKALINYPDWLPRVRVLKLRNGGTGLWGGGRDECNHNCSIGYQEFDYDPCNKLDIGTPYAFRRVLL